MNNIIPFKKMPPKNDDRCCMCEESATTTLALVNGDDGTDITKFFCSKHAAINAADIISSALENFHLKRGP